MTDLYAAYGSNLSRAQMQRRCPGAIPLDGVLLPGWRLVLRRFALIEPAAAARCPIGLWRITPRHLASLDRHEGTPLVYERRKVAVPGHGEAWIYLERRYRDGPPAADYVARLRAGYADFGFDPAPLEAALAGWPALLRPAAAGRR